MKLVQSIFIFVLVASYQSIFADTFDIGGSKIQVPTPDGYVKVTDAMPNLKRVTDALASSDSMNDTLATYVPEALVSSADQDNVTLVRYFILKANKEITGKTVSVKEFSEFRAAIRKENEKMFDDVKAKCPDLVERLSQNVSKAFEATVNFDIPSMIPLKPHLENQDAIAMSMYINYKATTERGNFEGTTSCTVALLNVAGKAMNLNSYGNKDDLDWTRSASEAWSKAILSVNPSPKKNNSWINWSQTGQGAIMGGLVGGVCALLAALIKKKKKPQI